MQERSSLDDAAFQVKFEALLAQAPAGTVKDAHFLRVPSNKAPWLDTGIDLKVGDQISTFSTGATSLKGTPISFPAALQIWCRIGEDGEIFRGTRASNSFKADKAGRLYAGTMFPGGSEAVPGRWRFPRKPTTWPKAI